MRIVVEIDDEEIRQLLAPALRQPTSPKPEVSDRLLKITEVAERLGISRAKAYELISRGRIPSLTIGRSRRVSSAALSNFISNETE